MWSDADSTASSTTLDAHRTGRADGFVARRELDRTQSGPGSGCGESGDGGETASSCGGQWQHPHHTIRLADLVKARDVYRRLSSEERQSRIHTVENESGLDCADACAAAPRSVCDEASPNYECDAAGDGDAPGAGGTLAKEGSQWRQSQRVDLRPVMELSPHHVMHTMPLPRLHHLFRQLGLRHLYVTDTRNQLLGVVTRKDLLPEVLEANALEPSLTRPERSERFTRCFTPGSRRMPKVPAHAHRLMRKLSISRTLSSVSAALSLSPRSSCSSPSGRHTQGCGLRSRSATAATKLSAGFRRTHTLPQSGFGRLRDCGDAV